jgi:hypothetical protein
MFLLSLVGFDGRGGKFNPHMMEFKVSPDFVLISAKAVALTSLPILPQRLTEHELEISLNVQVQPHCLAPTAAASQSRL